MYVKEREMPEKQKTVFWLNLISQKKQAEKKGLFLKHLLSYSNEVLNDKVDI